MRVGDLGEFALIERLRQALPARAPRELVVGIGDDAAIWRAGDAYVVATTDTMVDGVHFLGGTARPEDVGWKALASNVSDVAAMGGTPNFALVTLCLPPDTELAVIDGLYRGLRECVDSYCVTIAGGDIVASPVMTLTIALFGDAEASADGAPLVLRRDGAKAGDAIAVTGPLGGSAGGLRAIRSEEPLSGEMRALAQRHQRPKPRVDAGRAAVSAGVVCAIDISDGLAQDVGHICEASGLDAEVRVADVPVDSALVACYPDDAVELALSGGEDYELVLVAPEEKLRAVSSQLAAPVTIIGRMLRTRGGHVRLVDGAGEPVRLRAAGWDHFDGRART